MRRKLQRWRALAAIATGMVTLAGMAVLAAAPAQASTGGHPGTGAAGGRRHNPKTSAAHYTNAPCNTVRLKANHARCMAIVHTGVNHKIVATPNQPPTGALGPSDIQSAYKLPATGAGQTVAIVDAFGDSSAESDLATFRSFYGLPPCTTANGCFQKVDQNGGTNYPPDDSGWALETSLDLDAVSSRLPQLPHPAGGGRRQQHRQPRHRREHRGVPGREVRVQLLRHPRRGPRPRSTSTSTTPTRAWRSSPPPVTPAT